MPMYKTQLDMFEDEPTVRMRPEELPQPDPTESLRLEVEKLQAENENLRALVRAMVHRASED